MLEGVLRLRIESLLVEELGAREFLERGIEVDLGTLHHAVENRLGELPSDHGSGLKYVFLALCKPVDAGSEHGLDRGGKSQLCRGAHQPIRSLRACDAPGLGERLHDLLDEEGVSARALSNPFFERGE